MTNRIGDGDVECREAELRRARGGERGHWTSVGGAINVFVNCPTDVLFDINGYFAPSSLEAEAELKLRAD